MRVARRRSVALSSEMDVDITVRTWHCRAFCLRRLTFRRPVTLTWRSWHPCGCPRAPCARVCPTAAARALVARASRGPPRSGLATVDSPPPTAPRSSPATMPPRPPTTPRLPSRRRRTSTAGAPTPTSQTASRTPQRSDSSPRNSSRPSA